VKGSPIGAHIQIDPVYDCNSLPAPDARTICRAFQVYGAYITDYHANGDYIIVQMARDVDNYDRVATINGRDAVENSGIFKRSGWKLSLRTAAIRVA